jgi:hypothetical protein
MDQAKANAIFSSYQKKVVALLTLIQFTLVLDFMVMAPLGDVLMKSLLLFFYTGFTLAHYYAAWLVRTSYCC